MKLAQVGLSFGLAMVLANAALAQKVTTDYTKGTDFSRYKTFAWIKEPDAKNPLTNQRIIDGVNEALTSKGLKLVTADADLAIAAHAATEKQRTLSTFYDGFGGGWRWRGGFGSSTTMVSTFTVGTLVIDIFDARSKEALWRGTSTKTLSDSPQKRADSLDKAVSKMFKNFPPSSIARSN
jgi:hypothetical protein